MQKNLFIEGIQGSGKSTLSRELAKRLPEFHVYHEGDISPVELAWCSYMKKEVWEGMLQKYPTLADEIKAKTQIEGEYYITAYTRIMAESRSFYEDMEAYEIYNGRVEFDFFHDVIMRRYAAFSEEGCVFECSFFQNSMETMLLYYQLSDEEILAFYQEAYDILKDKGFQMIYLDSEKIRENILQIKKERSDDAVTINRTYSYEELRNGNLYVTVTLESEENIARPVKIEVDTTEEDASGESN